MTKDYAENIENALKSCLPSTDCREKKLIDAMAYSLEAGVSVRILCSRLTAFAAEVRSLQRHLPVQLK